MRWMYRHKYYDVLGERQEKKKSSFKTEKAALKALLKVKADILDGNFQQVEKSDLTISQWLDIWYETYHVYWKERTQKIRKQSIKNQIKPLLGKHKLVSLTKSTYQRVFINKLLTSYAPSTVQMHNTIFKTAINAAVEDEIIPRNRFSKVSIEKNKETDNYLSVAGLNLFLKVAKQVTSIDCYHAILLMAYTGVRIGEAMGLQWKNIDFKGKTITVEFTRDLDGVRPPKTKNSERTIRVDGLVLEQLRFYQKKCMETKLSKGLPFDKENDFVFISRYGTPLAGNTINTAFSKIYKYVDKEKLTLKRITPHGLRHTHATILINQGTPVKVVADRLGNTPGMINSVYAHSLKIVEDQAVVDFSNTLAGAKIGAS